EPTPPPRCQECTAAQIPISFPPLLRPKMTPRMDDASKKAAPPMSMPSVPESFRIAQWRALSPWVIDVAELDALAERRMIGAPQLEQRTGPGIAKRVLLQLPERGPCTVVRLCDLEPEAIR